jgi:two-component system, cell cycle sensor histidine kinase and response regulator CckA
MQIEAVYQRALKLRKRSTEIDVSEDLLEQSLKELYFVLEELQTSEEELRQQNQAMIAVQQEVELERQRYRTLFEMAPNGYLVTDLKGRIRKANHAAVRLLAIPQEYLIKIPLAALVDESDLTLFHKRLIDLELVQAWEVSFNSRNGKLRTLAISAIHLINLYGQEDELLWSLQDILLTQ